MIQAKFLYLQDFSSSRRVSGHCIPGHKFGNWIEVGNESRRTGGSGHMIGLISFKDENIGPPEKKIQWDVK